MINCKTMPTYARFPVCLVKGKNAVAWDENGKEYIDFSAGIGVNSLGFADDGWVSAVADQLGKIQHVSNLYYNDAMLSLAEKLTEMSGMNEVFLCNSGTEANECAIKTARKYSFDKYGAGRNKIVTITNSFHGRTMESLTATAQDALHPDCFAPYPAGFGYATPENLFEICDDKTAAVMLETIQGEGGVLPFTATFLQSVAAFCNQNDILLIIDEVQTGIGRTGTLFSYEHHGIKPDIVTAAKGLGGGLPIGACLTGERLHGVMSAGTHGSTFGGNPAVCAGALYILSKMDAGFLCRVTELGGMAEHRISSYKNVTAVRGRGLMLGVDVDGKTGKEIAEKCLEKGLIVLTAKNAVRLLPPLSIDQKTLEKGLSILKSVIEENGK